MDRRTPPLLAVLSLLVAACGPAGSSPPPSADGYGPASPSAAASVAASPTQGPGQSPAANAGSGWLAYVVAGEATPAVTISRLDGTELRVVTSPDWFVGSALSWSPDARRIVFETIECDVDPCATELAVVDVFDGSTARLTDWPVDGRPTEYSLFDQQPDWSPDRTRIAFSTSREASGAGDIGRLAIVDVASGAIEVLPLPDGVVAVFHPAWSADGSEIAVEGRAADGTSGLYIVAADGNGAARLVTTAWAGGPFDWSPDGTTFVATATGEPVETAPGEFTVPQHIVLQPIDGSAPAWRTTGAATDQGPVWAAGGSKVVFQSDRSGGGLWMVDPDGGDPVQLPAAALAYAVDWVDDPPAGS